jgi:3D (Asp-Asp-Asp) domain-containing protein
MKNSTLLGSAASVLLLFSVISYSRTYIQQQDPRPIQSTQPVNPQANSAQTDAATREPVVAMSPESESAPATSATTVASAKPVILETIAVPARAYMATAYSLRGRTASGRPASRGLIAADPSVLPLGTRVRLEAGSWSGEYVVADTGGAVRGRKIDIWTPTSREAMQFGKRIVRLTVLELGGRKAKTVTDRPRLVSPTGSNSTSDNQQVTKPQE